MKFEIFGYSINIEKKAIADDTLPDDLRNAIETLQRYGKTLPPSKAKQEAAAKATKTRQENAKRKIQDAINLLRLEGEEITAYKVAKKAGVSYNTVKKYLVV